VIASFAWLIAVSERLTESVLMYVIYPLSYNL